MSDYQVLARKFRPRTFADVVGQGHVTKTLQNAIRLARIPHAFLFTGTRGCGKTSTARILAKALNCTASDSPAMEPCNECDNCAEITDGGSLDVLEIDGASNNGVESIRELRENVRFMPNKGRYKVYIIDEAHMLTQAAWNALLKTLEEPPAHVTFIFATTEPQKFPQTILSRVQRFDFKRIATRAIRERLEEICKAEGIELARTGLVELARAADGSLRDAQSLLDQLVSFAGDKISDEEVTEALGLIDRTLVSDLMRALATRDAGAALEISRRVADTGYDAETFARAVLGSLRDLMVVKLLDTPDDLLERTPEEIAELREIADTFTREEADALFSMLAAVLEDLRTGSPYLALEMALLRMTSVEPIAPIAELVERLEALSEGKAATPKSKKAGSSGGGGGGSSKPKLNKPKFMEDEPKPKKKAEAAPAEAPPTQAAPVPVPESDPDPVSAPAAAREPGGTAGTKAFDWEQFVAYVRNRGFLGTYLANHGWMESFRDDTLRIGIRKGTVAESSLASSEDKKNELTGYLRAFLDRPAKLEIAVIEREEPEEDRRSVPRTQAQPRRTSRSQLEEAKALREEALNEPTVKTAMDALNAELTEVRPLRGGPK